MKLNILLILVIISFTQTACKLKLNFDDERGDLVSSKLLSSHSISTMKSALVNSKYKAKYAVKTYRIIYQTIDDDGIILDASGLLVVPQKSSSKESPLFVHHHSTITKSSQAPSRLYKATNLLSKTASLGYIVIAPDYIGYGESKDKVHPYLHAKTLASSSVDMIRASKKWLKNHDKKINKQVFLEGYSEGGYAAMATHKKIEKSHDDEFTITASAPAAGPYNLSTTLSTLIDDDTLESPVYLAYIIKAYDEVYDSGLIKTAINPKYRNIVDTFISDGDYNTAEINDLLSNRTRKLLKNSFLRDVRDRSETKLTKHLKKNNIYDWKPKAPIRIIHGENDKIVPYANATKAVDKMIARGATDVELVDCDVEPFEARHDICSIFAYNHAISFFFSLANDL